MDRRREQCNGGVSDIGGNIGSGIDNYWILVMVLRSTLFVVVEPLVRGVKIVWGGKWA